MRRAGSRSASRCTAMRRAVSSVAFSPDGTRIVSGSCGQDAAAVGCAERAADRRAAARPRGRGLERGVQPRRHAHRLAAARTGRCGCGMRRAGSRSASRCAATRTGSRAWRSAPTARASSAAVGTRRCGCGMRRAASRSASRCAATRTGSRAWRSAPMARASSRGSRDRTLRLWDAKSGQPIGEPLRGHEGAVSSVAFSPDGTRIVERQSGQDAAAVGCEERAADRRAAARPRGQRSRAWRSAPTARASSAAVRTRRCGCGMRRAGSRSASRCAATRARSRASRSAPDGTRIVSGSWDQTLRLWDAKLLEAGDRLGAVLCQTAHRNLSKAEWKQYVPEGEAYRAVCDHLPLND